MKLKQNGRFASCFSKLKLMIQEERFEILHQIDHQVNIFYVPFII